MIGMQPDWNTIQHNPRFTEILKRIGLSADAPPM